MNERNADVSKTLTEQRKKSKLQNGWYWVEGSRAEGIYAYTAEYLNNVYRPRNGEKIIEQVPSYEEYQKLLSDQLAKNEGAEINAELEERLKKTQELEQDFFAYQKMLNEANKDLNKYYLENTKLKELLKECRDKWVCYKPYDRDQLLKRIDKILANNKIQANTVACNKIQENEDEQKS